jgi:hypothetical protein
MSDGGSKADPGVVERTTMLNLRRCRVVVNTCSSEGLNIGGEGGGRGIMGRGMTTPRNDNVRRRRSPPSDSKGDEVGTTEEGGRRASLHVVK